MSGEYSTAWRWALFALVMLGSLLLWRSEVKQTKLAQTQLLLHWHSWLMRRFGLQHSGQPPSTLETGPLKSHRVLRMSEQVLSAAQAGRQSDKSLGATAYSHQLNVEAILQDEQQRFWLVIFHSGYVPDKKLAEADHVKLLDEPAVIRISELRARRALFHSPDAYQKAFGEAPSRASLDTWRKRHPEQEPRDSRW